jgi:hypothetical protein
MRKTIGLALLSLATFACASLTPEGKAVRVYSTQLKTAGAPAPPLPSGCRMLKSWGPITEETEARHIADPYRAQRNEAAAAGGNVLLVRSYRFMEKKKTDCPMSDNSPDCAANAQNWYKTSFDSYGCDASALQALSELKPDPESGAWGVLWAAKKSEPAPAAAPIAPAAASAPAAAPASMAVPVPPGQPAAPSASTALLKSKVLALMQEGVGADVIQSYVRANRLAAPLTAEEIIDWKKSGISDAVIGATFPN